MERQIRKQKRQLVLGGEKRKEKKLEFIWNQLTKSQKEVFMHPFTKASEMMSFQLSYGFRRSYDSWVKYYLENSLSFFVLQFLIVYSLRTQIPLRERRYQVVKNRTKQGNPTTSTKAMEIVCNLINDKQYRSWRNSPIKKVKISIIDSKTNDVVFNIQGQRQND